MTRLGNGHENPGDVASLGDRRLVKVFHEREVGAEPPQGLKETKKKTNKPSLTRNGSLGQLADRGVSYAATRRRPWISASPAPGRPASTALEPCLWGPPASTQGQCVPVRSPEQMEAVMPR